MVVAHKMLASRRCSVEQLLTLLLLRGVLLANWRSLQCQAAALSSHGFPTKLKTSSTTSAVLSVPVPLVTPPQATAEETAAPLPPPPQVPPQPPETYKSASQSQLIYEQHPRYLPFYIPKLKDGLSDPSTTATPPVISVPVPVPLVTPPQAAAEAEVKPVPPVAISAVATPPVPLVAVSAV
eukprot:scpid103975/ scgid24136/ 